MDRKYTIPAAVMIGYAALMILAGIIAYFAAPPEANALTAIIIPGTAAVIMIICGMMTLRAPARPRLGRIGAHLGVVLTLVFALLFGFTAFTRTGAMQRHPAAVVEYRAAVERGEIVEADTDARREFFAERRAARHEIGYLVYTLWFLTGLSVVTFVVLLVLRPKPEATELPTAA